MWGVTPDPGTRPAPLEAPPAVLPRDLQRAWLHYRSARTWGGSIQSPPEALQKSQKSSFRSLIGTFDPEVPGYVFWPIIFGVGAIFALVVLGGF